MSMIVTHNISALNTQRTLALTNRALGKSLEKLSSGYRINIGADGPADLIISEQLRAQNIGLERAVRNTQEAINVIGIAEGALTEMNEILKKMRALALHAANSGITSPIQVAADQAEIDSSIQTIDRIANTTKYSDQLLLNGSKSLVYERATVIKGTQSNSLVDVSLSRLDQIFKREDFKIDIAFNGTAAPDDDTAIGAADMTKEARRAYFEIDSANAEADVDAASSSLTKSQSFIVTGTKGSRLFAFDVGATMGQIASAINNVSDSTGVEASLIFSSSQSNNDLLGIAGAANGVVGGATERVAGDLFVSNNYNAAGGLVVSNVTAAPTQVILGQNTDGMGRIYVKAISDTAYELYKDASLSAESLIGHGTSGNAVLADNNSGIAGLTITLNANNAGHVSVLNLDGIEGANGVNYTGAFEADGGIIDNTFVQEEAAFTGVQLGKNTDSEGKIYLKVVMTNAAGSLGTVYAYNNSRMSDSDLVAKTQDGISLADATTVILSEIRNSEGTDGTGLAIALGIEDGFDTGLSDGDVVRAEVQFTNLGVRIASQEYGSNNYVRLQQNNGTVWQYYSQPDSPTATLVDASGGGVTVQQNGTNATLTINGQQVETDGLTLNLSTNDVAASLVFNEGKVGSTTIAQVGYMDGTVYTRAAMLTNVSATDVGDPDGGYAQSNTLANLGAVLTNAGHSTQETLEHFLGGMQYQLGEGSGDQERTIYSIQSMAVANLGRVDFTEQFDPSKAVIETRTLALQDILGGGLASLAIDPVKALAIIDKAIQDVSALRARLGATQSNLLQTNANSLRVAIENIQRTESAIRDADMAAETTEFTKNQILVSAGTSMLAQANVMAQNVLQLLG